MDELELLKKDWKNNNAQFKQVSENEIYGMLHKSSSSIVKWILIICIAEFLFWGFINLLIPDSFFAIYEKLHLKTLLQASYALHYTIVIVFIYLFYKNYKSIQVTDSTNVLMQNILNTRKTVRYFVYYNVGMTIAFSIAIDTYLYNNSEKLYEVMGLAKQGIPKEGFANIFIISQIIVGFIIIALLILFYWLVYGILLKKLKGNYRELKKINS